MNIYCFVSTEFSVTQILKYTIMSECPICVDIVELVSPPAEYCDHEICMSCWVNTGERNPLCPICGCDLTKWMESLKININSKEMCDEDENLFSEFEISSNPYVNSMGYLVFPQTSGSEGDELIARGVITTVPGLVYLWERNSYGGTFYTRASASLYDRNSSYEENLNRVLSSCTSTVKRLRKEMISREKWMRRANNYMRRGGSMRSLRIFPLRDLTTLSTPLIGPLAKFKGRTLLEQ